MSSILRLGILAPSLSRGCCPNNVFATIFDSEDGLALKKLTSDPDSWGLASFMRADEADFFIPLSEDTQRVRYYYGLLSTDIVTLPVTTGHKYYTIEYWYQASGTATRDLAALLGVQKVCWDGIGLSDYVLSPSQLAALQPVNVTASIAYNSTTKVVSGLIFMERGGRLVENVSSVLLEWYDPSSGDLILSASLNGDMSNCPGVFRFDRPGIDLVGDIASPLVISVLEPDGTTTKSVTSVVTWD